MLLNSVILILQETLEAALLISVLLAITSQLHANKKWLVYSIIFGCIGSYLYAFNINYISEWFDYVGQEVLNATLQAIIVIFVASYAMLIFRALRYSTIHTDAATQWHGASISLAATGIVATAIIREGTEILLYLNGFMQTHTEATAVLIGSSIGFGIGLSIGIILFYILLSLQKKWSLTISILLLALFAGNMASQAALQLTQADWLEPTRGLWDTSSWIPESSVFGQLLYATLGYEATPSSAQVISYISGFSIILLNAIIGWKFPGFIKSEVYS